MSVPKTTTTLELAHTAMSEAEALRFLEGQRISRGGRTMDPKAQIVGEFVKSIRVPGYFPPLPELRQQLRTMVALMDEPAPPLPRVVDITIPAPTAAIPARIYDPVGATGQIHAFISLTKVIPQGTECTLEVADYLRRRLGSR
jgi:acetyl esterase